VAGGDGTTRPRPQDEAIFFVFGTFWPDEGTRDCFDFNYLIIYLLSHSGSLAGKTHE
jgi:hypothetical protein